MSLAFVSMETAGGVLERLFVPRPNALQEFAASNESNCATIDHSDWDVLLARYLDADHPSGVWRLDYRAVAAEDRGRLDRYLAKLQSIDPRDYRRAVQMAYWINLYNARTVALILDHPDANSIRDIRTGVFSVGPWSRQLLQVADRRLSLDDVEHRVLRPLFSDPRIHFAVNCASIGCPNLAPRAYTAQNLETLLDSAAKAYVNHPRGARFEQERLVLSSIFDWYREDFGGSRTQVLLYIARYADPAMAERLAEYRGPIRFEYDWSLNAPPTARAQ